MLLNRTVQDRNLPFNDNRYLVKGTTEGTQTVMSDIAFTGDLSFDDLELTSLTAFGMLYASATKAITSTAAPTNGQILIGSTGAIPVLGAITGTANRVTVTLGAGTIALTGPQDIHTAATPQFAKQALGMAVGNYLFEIRDTAAATNKISALSESGVAHGMTTIEDTTVYKHARFNDPSAGGLILRGLAGNTVEGMRMESYSNAGIFADSGFSLRAYKKNGTGITDIGATDYLCDWYNNGTSALRLYGGGGLDIKGRVYVATVGSMHSIENYANNYVGAWLTFDKTRGVTPGAMTIVNNGDYLGQLEFRGADGAAQRTAAQILAEVDGAPAAGDMPGRLSFWTTPDGAATAVERVRVSNNGYVGIGVTATAASLLELYSTTTTALTLSAYLNGGGITQVLYKTGFATGDVTPYAVKAATGYDNTGGAYRIALGTTIASSTNWALTATGMGVGTAAPVSLGEFSSATAPILTISAATANDVDPELRFNHNSAVHASIGVDHSAGLLVLNYGGASGIGGTTQLCMNATGDVGIGVAASAAAKLYVVPTATNATYWGEYLNMTHTVTSNLTVNGIGLNFQVATAISNGITNSGYVAGVFFNAYHASAGALATLYGLYSSYGATSTGNITGNVYGAYLNPNAAVGTTTGTLYDIYISAKTGSGTITNEWALYCAHAAPSYFANQIKVGATTAGTAAQLGYLYVGGSTAIGFNNQIVSIPATDANAIGYINYSGYLFGYTRFRDLYIGNGKAATVLYVDGVNTRVGIGAAMTAPAATLHSQSTTTQLRLGYDAASYVDFTVADTTSALNIAMAEGGTFTLDNSSIAANDCILRLLAGEAKSPIIKLIADDGDDIADTFYLTNVYNATSASNVFKIQNDNAVKGTPVDLLTLTTAGAMALPVGRLAIGATAAVGTERVYLKGTLAAAGNDMLLLDGNKGSSDYSKYLFEVRTDAPQMLNITARHDDGTYHGNILSLLHGGGIATDGGTNYWTLGGYTTTAPAATGYVTVTIAGTTYKLLAST